MEAFGVNLPGLITQLVSFLILLFILTKLLRKPILRTLYRRAERIIALIARARRKE